MIAYRVSRQIKGLKTDQFALAMMDILTYQTIQCVKDATQDVQHALDLIIIIAIVASLMIK